MGVRCFSFGFVRILFQIIRWLKTFMIGFCVMFLMVKITTAGVKTTCSSGTVKSETEAFRFFTKLVFLCQHIFQFRQFLLCQIPPGADFNAIELDVHNSYSFECNYFVIEVLTHAPDLAVQSLGKNYSKGIVACFFYKTWIGNRAKYGNAG